MSCIIHKKEQDKYDGQSRSLALSGCEVSVAAQQRAQEPVFVGIFSLGVAYTLLGLPEEWVNSEELIGALERPAHLPPCSPIVSLRTAVAHPHLTIANSCPLQIAFGHGHMFWVLARDTARTDALLCLAICWIVAEPLIAAIDGHCDRLPIGPPRIVAHLHLSCANALPAHGAGRHCRVVWVLACHPTVLVLDDTTMPDRGCQLCAIAIVA
jgi:hypothetical protein